MTNDTLNIEEDAEATPDAQNNSSAVKSPKNRFDGAVDVDNVVITRQSHIDESKEKGLSLSNENETPEMSDYTSKLKYARKYYFSSGRLETHSLESDTFDMLWEDFSGYRESEDYVLLKQNNGFEDGSYFAMKLPKRGNSKYREEKKKKIQRLLDGINESDMKLDYTDDETTQALFVTFTYDTDRCTISEGWNKIGEEYNKAITSLRQEYGHISAFRTFESTTSAYPHIHAVLLFHDHEFDTFQQSDGTHRIESKSEFVDICNWHSYIDVEAVDNIGKSINYLSEYLIKDTVEIAESSKSIRKAKLTLSLTWLFRKRSFAVSGDFREVLLDLIQSMSNSNRFVELYHMFRWLEGIEYEFIGTFGSDFLEIERFENYVEIDRRIINKVDLIEEVESNRRSVKYDEQ